MCLVMRERERERERDSFQPLTICVNNMCLLDASLYASVSQNGREGRKRMIIGYCWARNIWNVLSFETKINNGEDNYIIIGKCQCAIKVIGMIQHEL